MKNKKNVLWKLQIIPLVVILFYSNSSPANDTHNAGFVNVVSYSVKLIFDVAFHDNQSTSTETIPPSRIMSGDFNGDNRTDFVHYWYDEGEWSADVSLSQSEAFLKDNWATRLLEYNDQQFWKIGDFDGDTKTDLVASSIDDYGYLSIEIIRSTGDSFDNDVSIQKIGMDTCITPAAEIYAGQGSPVLNLADPEFEPEPACGYIRWVNGDFNGDLRTDLLRVWVDNGSPTIDAYFFGDSDVTFNRLNSFPDSYESRFINDDIHSADFDGDGKLDLLFTSINNGYLSTKVFLLKGSSFEPQTTSTNLGNGELSVDDIVKIGDFNKDNINDVLYISPSGSQTILSLFLMSSNGVSSFRTVVDRILNTNELLLGDFDNDGDMDLVSQLQEDGEHTANVYLSNGVGFDKREWNMGTGMLRPLNASTCTYSSDTDSSTGDSIMLSSILSASCTTGDSYFGFQAVGDTNGDGTSDLLHIWKLNGEWGSNIQLSTNYSFVNTQNEVDSMRYAVILPAISLLLH